MSTNPPPPDLQDTAFAGLRVGEYLGTGCRCDVYAAGANGELVLKVYHRHAAEKHQRRHGVPVARYEFERNRELLAIPGLMPHVARPVAYHACPAAELFLQQRVRGESFAGFAGRGHCRDEVPGLLAQLLQIVMQAHRAGFYDLDLRAENILVVRALHGSPRPMLFDFNKLPHHEHPPNPAYEMLVACGIIGPASRDLRYLRRLRQMCSGGHFRWRHLFWSMPVPSLAANLEVLLGL